MVHRDLLLAAAQDARLILSRDPKLESARGRAVAVLTELFDWRPDRSNAPAA
jgi:ATP-dependent DNA helicase RecG